MILVEKAGLRAGLAVTVGELAASAGDAVKRLSTKAPSTIR